MTIPHSSMILITPCTHHNLKSCAAQLNLTLEGLAFSSTCPKSALLLNNCVVEVQTLLRFLDLIPGDEWQRDQVERSGNGQPETEEGSDQERSPGIRSSDLGRPELRSNELRSPEPRSPKEHDYQSRSPKKHDYLSPRSKEHDYQSWSPKEHDYQSRSPKEHDYQSRSPKEHDYQSRRSKEHDYQSRSPKEHDYQSRSPIKNDYQSRSPIKHDSQTRRPEKHNYYARSPQKYDSGTQIPEKQASLIQTTGVKKLLEQSLEDHELLERSLDEMDKRVERLIEELSPEKSPRKEWSPNKPKKINAVEKAFLDATIDSALRDSRDRKGNSGSVGSLLEFPQPMFNSTMMNSTMLNDSAGVPCEMIPVEQRIDAVNACLGALMKDVDKQRSAVSHRRSSFDARLRSLREGLDESLEGEYLNTSRGVDDATRGAVLRALGKRNERNTEKNFKYLSMEDAIRNINCSLDGMLNESFDRSHMSG